MLKKFSYWTASLLFLWGTGPISRILCTDSTQDLDV